MYLCSVHGSDSPNDPEKGIKGEKKQHDPCIGAVSRRWIEHIRVQCAAYGKQYEIEDEATQQCRVSVVGDRNRPILIGIERMRATNLYSFLLSHNGRQRTQ